MRFEPWSASGHQAAAPTWQPGQFLTLGLPCGPDGALLWRCYSICDAQTLRVAVRRVAGGLGSGYIHDALREGMVLDALAPSGDFIWTASAQAGHLLLIAGGSGITPLKAILEAALGGEPERRVTLIYAGQSLEQLAFVQDLEALRAAHPQRLQVRYTLEQAAPGFQSGVGRLDTDELARHLSCCLDDSPGAKLEPVEAFICGPAPMMEQAVALLKRWGLEASSIHTERFAPEHQPQEASAPAPDSPRYTLHVERGGQRHALLASASQTLLEAALDAGVALPHACRSGRCGSCTMRLVSGQVTARAPSLALLDEERAAGLILPCVCQAASDCHLAAR